MGNTHSLNDNTYSQQAVQYPNLLKQFSLIKAKKQIKINILFPKQMRLNNFHFTANLDPTYESQSQTLENLKILTVNDLYFLAEQYIFRNGVFGRKILYLESFSQNEALDYFLTQRSMSLECLLENQIYGLDLKAFFKNAKLKGEVSPDRKVKNGVSLSDFMIIRELGKGGFSRVQLVRSKFNGNLYALKSIKKELLDTEQKQNSVEVERQILEKVKNNHIILMHHYFETDNYYHYILDFCPGGELYFHLKNLSKFDEKLAKSIIPENILIDINGKIKLTDFGLSKLNFTQRQRTFSFCGSPEYLSPEMLSYNMQVHQLKNMKYNQSIDYISEQVEGYGFMIDFYSLGVLMYEMLVGLPPFYDPNKMKMFNMILYKEPKFPGSMSIKAKDLLSRLLEKNPNKRIGNYQGIRDIKSHPFFGDINWNSDNYKVQLKPSFIFSNFKANEIGSFQTRKSSFLVMDRPISTLGKQSPKKKINNIFSGRKHSDNSIMKIRSKDTTPQKEEILIEEVQEEEILNPSHLIDNNQFFRSSIIDKFQQNPFVQPMKRDLSSNSIYDPLAPMETSTCNVVSQYGSPNKIKIATIEEDPEIIDDDEIEVSMSLPKQQGASKVFTREYFKPKDKFQETNFSNIKMIHSSDIRKVSSKKKLRQLHMFKSQQFDSSSNDGGSGIQKQTQNKTMSQLNRQRSLERPQIMESTLFKTQYDSRKLNFYQQIQELSEHGLIFSSKSISKKCSPKRFRLSQNSIDLSRCNDDFPLSDNLRDSITKTHLNDNSNNRETNLFNFKIQPQQMSILHTSSFDEDKLTARSIHQRRLVTQVEEQHHNKSLLNTDSDSYRETMQDNNYISKRSNSSANYNQVKKTQEELTQKFKALGVTKKIPQFFGVEKKNPKVFGDHTNSLNKSKTQLNQSMKPQNFKHFIVRPQLQKSATQNVSDENIKDTLDSDKMGMSTSFNDNSTKSKAYSTKTIQINLLQCQKKISCQQQNAKNVIERPQSSSYQIKNTKHQTSEQYTKIIEYIQKPQMSNSSQQSIREDEKTRNMSLKRPIISTLNINNLSETTKRIIDQVEQLNSMQPIISKQYQHQQQLQQLQTFQQQPSQQMNLNQHLKQMNAYGRKNSIMTPSSQVQAKNSANTALNKSLNRQAKPQKSYHTNTTNINVLSPRTAMPN
ncbi:camp-dependent protein kinase catalytic [Stylonychia lemnae]|uniref:Camp-dependent protein kinase catalytic n=1 Tax=Stylonychia lemnae TaxID=5949 RepID=A0A078AEW7_STYLE|nr:camp-dependent protein kinase catalytic [Stylonychia lemnae]|eukprot:CDW80366.1 camp-dependent protein kinase catalytic [Stylonychia lemnae]